MALGREMSTAPKLQEYGTLYLHLYIWYTNGSGGHSKCVGLFLFSRPQNSDRNDVGPYHLITFLGVGLVYKPKSIIC